MADTIDPEQLGTEIIHMISKACEELNNGIAEELTEIGREAADELRDLSEGYRRIQQKLDKHRITEQHRCERYGT